MSRNGQDLRGFVFYTQDYFGDLGVRLLPPDLRMVWVEAFLLMDKSPRRGVLLKPNGSPYRSEELAGIMNIPIDTVRAALQRVVEDGVASIDPETGAISNRKMTRDDARRKRGEEFASKRWSKSDGAGSPNGKPNGSPNGSPTGKPFATDPEPDPEPDPKHEPAKGNGDSAPLPRRDKTAEWPPEFLQFWEAYPRKEAKGAALKAWNRQSGKRPAIEKILAAIARSRASPKWQENGGEFIPHPATWLNSWRWDDEPALFKGDGNAPNRRSGGDAPETPRRGTYEPKQ